MYGIGDKLKQLLGGFYQPAVYVGKIIAIILASYVIIKVGSFIIRKFFEKQKLFKYGLDGKKIDTVSSLLVSILKYMVYIIAFVATLSDVFDIKSILAAAGIGGIAVGFGAQSLIKDLISGFFIVFENHYSVGDFISIEGMTGTVEELQLRITKLRGFNGDLHIIPNGEIKKVTNHTRGNKAVIVDIPLAYSSDINKAIEAASAVCETVSGEFKTITEPPRVLGLTEFGKESSILRIFAMTLPNAQWEVERRIRKLISEEFNKEGIYFNDISRMEFHRPYGKGGEADA